MISPRPETKVESSSTDGLSLYITQQAYGLGITASIVGRLPDGVGLRGYWWSIEGCGVRYTDTVSSPVFWLHKPGEYLVTVRTMDTLKRRHVFSKTITIQRVKT